MLCSKCQIDKQEDQFYKRSGRSGCLSECKECFRDRVGLRHQKHKDILVREFGGCCSRCRYNKSPRVLQFHHIDPATKKFGLSRSLSKNLDCLREEAAKCILLCPNCHAEKHLGLW